jgi:hypothetical protein
LSAPSPWKMFVRVLCLQQTDITHKQNNMFKVALLIRRTCSVKNCAKYKRTMTGYNLAESCKVSYGQKTTVSPTIISGNDNNKRKLQYRNVIRPFLLGKLQMSAISDQPEEVQVHQLRTRCMYTYNVFNFVLN